VAGAWRYTVNTPQGPERHLLQVVQHLDRVEGQVTIAGRSYPVTGRVEGVRLSYVVKRPLNGATVMQMFEGTVADNRIVGATATDDGTLANQEWFAQRSE
jgi:hypothetical protein